MGIRITCPECGRAGVAPSEAAGKKVRCPGCRAEFRVTAETPPGEELPVLGELSLRDRAEEFLARPLPRGLGDHSMGLGLIRAYAEGDEDKLQSPQYLKVLGTFLLVLRLEGKGGSRECQAYVAEEVELLSAIQAELQG